MNDGQPLVRVRDVVPDVDASGAAAVDADASVLLRPKLSPVLLVSRLSAPRSSETWDAEAVVSIDARGNGSLSFPLSFVVIVLSLFLCNLAVVLDKPKLDLKSASFAVSTLSTLALTLFLPFERVTVLSVSSGARAIWRKVLGCGGADWGFTVAAAGGG